MVKSKKALWITLISVDVALTVFLFVISIIMLATMPDLNGLSAIKSRGAQNMIEWFQINPTAYLCICVIPLFILLGVNIFGLIKYIKKSSAKKKLLVSDLSDAEKEALKAELLKDLNKPKE